MTLTQNTLLCTTIAAATLLLACMAITGAASAQTFNPQQPPDFGDFNGTRPDFGGNPPDFNGSQGFPGGMGPGGDFNGTMRGGPGGPGGGNFSRPDASGMPSMNGDDNGQGIGQVSSSQTDYTLIIVAVFAVVAVVAVASVMLVRKKRAAKTVSPSPVAQENFDF